MKTLLACIDFSDTSLPVLQAAKRFAEQLSARLVLLHVVEPAASYVPVGASMDVLVAPVPDIQPDENALRNRLERLAQSQGAPNAECRAVVGTAVSDILETAAAENADLIVLGSHGHGALYHLFSGSVVTGVLKRSHLPVVVIPTHNPNPSH